MNNIVTLNRNGYFPKPTKENAFNNEYVIRLGLFPLCVNIGGNKTTYKKWQDEDYRINNADKLLALNGESVEDKKNGGTYSAVITGASIITGKTSNLTVIDLDKHGTKRDDGTEINGIEEFEKLVNTYCTTEEERKQASDTFTVETPTGGRHLYFRYTDILENNSANGELAIDVRSEGGIIVAPGTNRKDDCAWDYNGTIYTDKNTLVEADDKKVPVSQVGKVVRQRWGTYKVIKDCEIQELPTALAEAIRNEYEKLTSGNTTTSSKTNKTNSNSSLLKSITKESELSKKLFPEEKIKEGGRETHLISVAGHYVRKYDDRVAWKHLCQHNQLYLDPPVAEKDLFRIFSTSIKKRNAESPYTNFKTGKTDIGKMVAYSSEKYPSFTRGNTMFRWNEKNKVYKKITHGHLQKEYYKLNENDSEIDDSKSRKYADTMMSYNRTVDDVAPNRNYIYCDDGIIDIITGEITPASSDIKLVCKFKGRVMTDEDYREAFDNSNFRKYLNSTFKYNDELINLFGEVMGNELCPHQRELETFTIFVGGGSNGKSVAFDIFESIYHNPNESIGCLKMNLFDKSKENRFRFENFEGKQANHSRDDALPRKLDPILKSLVTGENVLVEEKMKGQYVASFNASHIYSVNNLDTVEDKSDGMYRRMAIIPFEVKAGTKAEVSRGDADIVADPEMVRQITDNENDIVFNFAYRGFKRLQANGYKFSYCRKSEEYKEEYRKDSDSAYNFATKRLIKNKQSKVKKSLVIEEYKKFCEEEDISKPLGKKNFNNWLVLNYRVEVKPYGGIDYYRGIELKDTNYIDYELEFNKKNQECDKLTHQNEVSRALIEKLRNENAILQEAKTPIEDLNKYRREMDELLARITQLENEKKELELENETLSLIIEAKDEELKK